MSEQHILLVEPDGREADRVISTLRGMERTALAVPNCAEAAEALVLQRFDAVLLGSGQIPDEVRELTRYISSLGAHAPIVVSYSSGIGETIVRVLPRDFSPAQLAQALAPQLQSKANQPSAELPVFLQQEFAEQCADEKLLMIEIIDLFEAERHEQFAAMMDALGNGDFDRLAKLAHTLKGSVGALHAPAARQTCQAIELAAKDRDSKLCAAHLGKLEQNLTALAEPLRRFRQACLDA